jgi:DNA (cytosine-5)-methyltransferase 1
MTFIPDVSYSLTARAAMDRPESGSVTLIASTLRGRSHGEGVNMPGRGGEEAYGDNLIADTVRTHPRPGSNSLGSIAIRTAQTGSNGWGVGTDEQAYTLDGAQGQAVIHPALNVRDAKGPSSNADQAPPLVTSQGVRRLMPIECNRLQGFPDDWDRWTADGREIADSHRYRMMGNAVAVPVLEWIGRRLVAVDAL